MPATFLPSIPVFVGRNPLYSLCQSFVGARRVVGLVAQLLLLGQDPHALLHLLRVVMSIFELGLRHRKQRSDVFVHLREGRRAFHQDLFERSFQVSIVCRLGTATAPLVLESGTKWEEQI